MLYRIKCTLSYDGYDYMGYQIQNDANTIELNLMNAIKRITNKEVKIYAQGRTDRYVHALEQVIHFDTDMNIDDNHWLMGINTYLPDDIRILKVEHVDMDFHARFNVSSKEYRYYIMDHYDVFYRRYVSFIDGLDYDLMNEALKLLQGNHDFKGFASAQIDSRKETVKTIYDVKMNHLDNGITEFIFVGSGFLKYQIRRMMGLLIEIGLKRDKKETISLVLETKDPSIINKVAEGKGLFLYKVTY